MESATFIQLLHEISGASRDFATKYVSNRLHNSSLYFVYLGASFDGHPLKLGEKVFPEDDEHRGIRIGPLMAIEVSDLLCRDALVPEWIDISVGGSDLEHTYFNLYCCGRFTADESLFYYAASGQGPFGIKSPVFPPGWSEHNDRFKLPSINQ